MKYQVFLRWLNPHFYSKTGWPAPGTPLLLWNTASATRLLAILSLSINSLQLVQVLSILRLSVLPLRWFRLHCSASYTNWSFKASHSGAFYRFYPGSFSITGQQLGYCSSSAGDQSYVSLLIDLYPERDSDLEALYDSTADQEPVAYNDVMEAPSDSEVICHCGLAGNTLV